MQLPASCLCFLLLLAAPVQAAEELRVFAAASLTDALGEVAQRFQSATGQPVRLAFGASSDLARQLQAGAKADVFFSADLSRMEALERAGLVARGGEVALLGNRLVVVVPKDSALSLAEPRALAKVKRLAVADPESVPAGVYARQWLSSLKLWDEVRPRVVPTLDVRAALAAVETEAAEAGIVYATDAALSRKVKVALEVPAAQGPPIVYPVAALSASTHPAARRFVAFLQGPESRAVFERYGFRFLPQAK